MFAAVVVSGLFGAGVSWGMTQASLNGMRMDVTRAHARCARLEEWRIEAEGTTKVVIERVDSMKVLLQRIADKLGVMG